MSEPENHTLRLLQQIRQEMVQGFAEVKQQFAEVERKADARCHELVKGIDHHQQMLQGETVLARYAAAEVEERLDRIEKRLDRLEHRS